MKSKNRRFPPLFLYFCLFNTLDSKQMFDKSLPMTGFEPRISGLGGNRRTNWVTNTTTEEASFINGHLIELRIHLLNVKAKTILFLSQRLPSFSLCEFQTTATWGSNHVSGTLVRLLTYNLEIKSWIKIRSCYVDWYWRSRVLIGVKMIINLTITNDL